MKICYLANAQSIHTQRWAEHFTRQGHEVKVISFQFGEIEGVKTICLSSGVTVSPLNIVRLLPRMRRIIQEINPDILHAHYATSYGVAGALAGRKPLIITAWGSDVLIEPEKSWIYRQMVRFSLSRADLITSMAQHMTRHLVEKGYATADKIITLPFGVDTQVFNLSKRTRVHGNKQSIVISTRRLENGYDVDTYIRAIPKVLNSCMNVRFVIVGDGPIRTQLEKLAVSLGVIDSIEFRGQISHQEMPQLLGQCDVFVTTSPSDGNNISLNEAMACGAFPVATDIPANREWIENHRNGLLFPCRDVDQLSEMIIEAIQHPEWREATMEMNWDIVKKQASWSIRMMEMECHYFRLLKRENNLK
jgi:glycosyltransferase involved in cell wall biosynthesis